MAVPLRTTGAARWFTETQVGGPTRTQKTNITVLTTATVLVNNNPDRVELTLVNNGAQDVFVLNDPSVSTIKGVRLNANGGSVSLIVREDYTLVAEEWDAIVGSATTVVTVIEVLADLPLAPEQTS